MKKSVAILSVITKMSIYKIIAVLLFMGISQVAFVYMKIKQCIAQGESEKYSFEDYMDIKLLLVIFLIAFLLIFMILYWTYHEKRGVQTAYFYERISIGRNQRFAINMLYALFCYFLLYSWQMGVARLIEVMVRTMTMQVGEPIYQYISGIYYAYLLRGIWAVDIFVLVLFAVEVAKSGWRNNPPIVFILLFVWYSISYTKRSFRDVTGIALIVELGICILYIVMQNRKLWKNEKNMG